MQHTYKISVNIPIKFEKKIAEVMEKEDRTKSWVIRQALEQYLSKKTSKPKTKATKQVAPVIEVPSYIDGQLWLDFVDVRKTLKPPPTEQATKLILSKLDKMYNKGMDPNEALSNSIENGWKGVFEPKQKRSTARGKASQDFFDIIGGST